MFGQGEARNLGVLCAVLARPVWRCGKLKTGTVLANSIAISTLSNLHKPGNTSCPSRYFAKDTEKWVQEAQSGSLPDLQGPRSGMTLIHALLKTVTVSPKELGA